MAFNETGARRWRLERIPAAAWAAASLAALAALFAFATDASAAVLMLLAGAACYWALREGRRFTIQSRADDEIELVGLAELAPLLEALPDPALLIDAESRIVSSNAAARRQMQFEARGQFLTSILRHPDVLEAVQAAMREGETRAVEYESALQVERHMRCYVAPMNWGSERAAMLVFHDQTARISTERMRADFLANASHELRTPLASLTLLIETLAGPARESAADRDRFLAMMQVQADRMRRLIDDLLSLSRIELDEHVPPSDRADFAAVAREVIDALAPVAAERDVRIRLIEPAGPVRVVGERFQLAQVVQNLVDNAAKYTPAGGEVVVEVAEGGDREETCLRAGRRWDNAGRVAILTPAAAANVSYAYVRVEDAGPGIEEHFLPRLAERFFRVERELGNERGGTGLGLAIVKHIINRHRGGFLVESRPGRGSAFAAYVESAGED
ncbi:MAG TPA: ATP-binding protein [Vitreimonas sp.]|uniref:ATP-binding protein n=1 Tax=Vitreimonas sp. TaxID=3069702 RepID=UPI002D3D4AF2|nr:ATP-binding protein [Vitreimonas sp.]HYD88911.1 ATP-binding protein [Vitreimonas sp.]